MPYERRTSSSADQVIKDRKGLLDGGELFPSVIHKAAALANAVVQNHPIVDGNQPVAAVLMITLLRVNGLDLAADDDTAEEAFVGLAAGTIDLDAFTAWVIKHTQAIEGQP